MATEDPRASDMDDPSEGSRNVGANLAKEIEKTARRRKDSTRGKKSDNEDPSAEGDSSESSTSEEDLKNIFLGSNRSYVDEDEVLMEEEDLWNFPRDRERWSEEDLGETWLEYYGQSTLSGYDAELENPPPEKDDDEEQSELVIEEVDSEKPVWAPFYVPFKKFYPSIPNNHPDIETPEDTVEELERMEEFLTWISYIFRDGSSYEGTVWDDQAHGKGVYTTAAEVCRYEGEWLQNMMQGHGVLEIDIPVTEPVPDSEEAEKVKQGGGILKSDYMNPYDKEWFKMDVEDSFKKWTNYTNIAFEDDPYWSENFDEMPEKGHYRYAGQMKHNRMHGCGVYEINGRSIWGKFYFGELLPDPEECTHEISTFHASMAEVAAAKARMFVNKPDGMVRVARGPYNDPQHPYMYEEEDLWMAPGSINAYYKVPDPWKLYVEDVDKEREMWLNSFIKSPLRIPMPPELEYWWAKDLLPGTKRWYDHAPTS